MKPASRVARSLASLLGMALAAACLPSPAAADPGARQGPAPAASGAPRGGTFPPQHGTVPQNAGNGNDVAAQAPSGTISKATGSFDSVTGVTAGGETSLVEATGQQAANAYTLQLNTNYFSSPLCLNSANPGGCKGWQQFLYFSDGGTGSYVAVREWLLQYSLAAGDTCLPGWTAFRFTGSNDLHCWRDAARATTNTFDVASLGSLSLTGTLGAAGDTVTLSNGAPVTSATGVTSVGAAAGWTIAEFNVFGAGGGPAGGNQAVFSGTVSMVPRIQIDYGGTAKPVCVVQGFSAETNNLGFGAKPPPSGTGPAIIFTESSGGTPAFCAMATTIGDTHLMTLAGTFYDFQASGDFVLLERPEAGFEVQARQVSGAPSWPNASINKGVAARLGKARVAVCLAPVGLAVDGKRTALADGKTLRLAGGAQVSRQGNVYLLRSAAGDSVRAEVVDPYINVTVGLGRWPDTVRGVLANPKDDPTEVAARDGAVLKAPFPSAGLYGHFADSWRVAAKDSLLAPCGKVGKKAPQPPKPFFAKDLKPQAREKALAACRQAGVKEETLLDACVLDVTVIGKASAAKVFATHRTPVVVGDGPLRGRGGGGDKDDGKEKGK